MLFRAKEIINGLCLLKSLLGANFVTRLRRLLIVITKFCKSFIKVHVSFSFRNLFIMFLSDLMSLSANADLVSFSVVYM